VKVRIPQNNIFFLSQLETDFCELFQNFSHEIAQQNLKIFAVKLCVELENCKSPKLRKEATRLKATEQLDGAVQISFC
jgi:hypothetical protein